MSTPKRRLFVFVIIGLAVIAPAVHAQEAIQSEREAMYSRYLEFPSYVKGGSITPHWMADGSSFWYAEGAPANTVIWKVDPKANTKTPLFDTARLRQALTPLLGHEPPYQGIPFEEFSFLDGEKAVKFAVESKEFILQLDTYEITRGAVLSDEEKGRLVPRAVRKGLFAHSSPVMEVLSPDRRWFAGVKEHNLWLRSTDDGRSVQISSDGVEEYGWDVEGARWSPDSFKLAVKKVDSRQVPQIPMVHWLKATEEVEWVHYTKAGQPIPRTELFVVDVLSKRWIRVDAGEEPDQYLLILGWREEGSELIFFRLSRDLKKLELMVFNPTSGSTRIVLTETQNTFLQAGPWWGWTRLLTFLEDGKRFIWISERDGWNHLYLYGLNGNLIHRLSEGTFPVVQVITVDDKAGWVYFIAHGDPQHPYDTHLYRVDLEGKRSTRLTEAPGQHDIDFAPSKEFVVDTHSGVDRPPAVELRRADGTLLRTLAKANIDALKELKWSPPEEFVVKAADGKTDLYGVLYKPYDFDPKKKYPVIEVIDDGPFITVVPRAFTHPYGYGVLPQALAQLGFISFVVDVRGSAERGKKFQDVIYGNIGRTEIPDHAATLKQLAGRRPSMDLSRVGVVGFSYGGYFAIRALLLAPDVYHVGVAYSPITDMPEHWGLQVFLGPPQTNREAWEYASNLRLAGNLKGELLLVHGTSDDIVPFSHTMKMVEALIRADKPYDLIVLPEQGFVLSGTSERYWQDSIRRYFQEHLKP